MTDIGPEQGSFAPLRERLREINYWWPDTDAEYQPNRPGSIPVEKSWDFYKSDSLMALSNLAWSGEGGKTRFFAITGPENTGKTTILSQFIRLFVDDEFRELLWTLPDSAEATRPASSHLERRIAWAIDKYHYWPEADQEDNPGLVAELQELGPNRVLYLPLSSDPSFQLRPEKQLREAIEFYEEEILDGDPAETRHYIFIDDVHTLTGDVDEPGWGEYIADIIAESSARKVVVTAASEKSVEKELYDPERDRMRLDPDAYTIETTTSLKFRDYLQRRYPIFEGTDTEDRVDLDYAGELEGEYASNQHDQQNPDTYRISGSILRYGVQDAIKEDDPAYLYDPNDASDDPDADRLGDFEDQLKRIYELVGSGGKESPHKWIQDALDEYLLLGGYMGLRLDDDLFELSDDEFRTYLGGEEVGERSFAEDARAALHETVGSIHEQASAFGSIRQHRTRDLSRLFAWAAHTLETEPFDYDELLGEHSEDDDWILDVDRRTLREKYFDTLEQMILLTFSDGYGHKKPRELRVALRDTGLANALCWRDLDDVVDADTSLRRALEYMVAFDHVMRFSYNVNDSRDPNVGVVRYWQEGDDFVEFVPKIWGAPVPIGLDTTSDPPVEKIDTVGRFLDTQSSDPDAEVHDFVRYEPAVGEPRTGPSGDVKKLRGWFDESVIEALDSSGRVKSLGDIWAASVEDLTELEGIDVDTARELDEAIDLYDTLTDVRGIGPSKQETLWSPGEDHRPSPDQPHWTVDALARADPEEITDIDGFTATTAERAVQAARTRQQQQTGESEYARRLDLLLEGDDDRWPGVDELGSDGESDYRGRYEAYEWGNKDEDEDEDEDVETFGSSGRIHHRIHDGEAPFGIVLTSGSKVDRYESAEEGKPIFTIPLWMFLSLV